MNDNITHAEIKSWWEQHEDGTWSLMEKARYWDARYPGNDEGFAYLRAIRDRISPKEYFKEVLQGNG